MSRPACRAPVARPGGEARGLSHARSHARTHVCTHADTATLPSARGPPPCPCHAAGDCSLKEAIIFGSVLSKTSIPQLHSAAALIKMAGMPYSGAASIFLRLMVNKKYTLPYLAVDALVAHFAGFRDVEGPLPVIWHQALLALAQRYKADCTHAQKEALKGVMAVHAHHAITPEVRRELFSAGCRGDPVAAPPASSSGRRAGGGGSAPAVARGQPPAGTPASAKPAAKRAPTGDSMDDVF